MITPAQAIPMMGLAVTSPYNCTVATLASTDSFGQDKFHQLDTPNFTVQGQPTPNLTSGNTSPAQDPSDLGNGTATGKKRKTAMPELVDNLRFPTTPSVSKSSMTANHVATDGKSTFASSKPTAKRQKTVTGKATPEQSTTRTSLNPKSTDMTGAQLKIYAPMKRILLKVMFSENPYLAGNEITQRITKDWEEEVKKQKMELKDCPFDALPRLVLNKYYQRFKSRFLTQTREKIADIFDISTQGGAVPEATVQALLRDYTYVIHDPSIENVGRLYYFNTAAPNLIAEVIAVNKIIRPSDVQSWISPIFIAFVFTIIHFGLKKSLSGKQATKTEDHAAKVVYEEHLAQIKALYGTDDLLAKLKTEFLKHVDARIKKDELSQPAPEEKLKGDGRSLEERKQALELYLQSQHSAVATTQPEAQTDSATEPNDSNGSLHQQAAAATQPEPETNSATEPDDSNGNHHQQAAAVTQPKPQTSSTTRSRGSNGDQDQQTATVTGSEPQPSVRGRLRGRPTKK